jgi:hypothetical protein
MDKYTLGKNDKETTETENKTQSIHTEKQIKRKLQRRKETEK